MTIRFTTRSVNVNNDAFTRVLPYDIVDNTQNPFNAVGWLCDQNVNSHMRLLEHVSGHRAVAVSSFCFYKLKQGDFDGALNLLERSIDRCRRAVSDIDSISLFSFPLLSRQSLEVIRSKLGLINRFLAMTVVSFDAD